MEIMLNGYRLTMAMFPWELLKAQLFQLSNELGMQNKQWDLNIEESFVMATTYCYTEKCKALFF